MSNVDGVSPEKAALSLITNEVKYKHFTPVVVQRSLGRGGIIDSACPLILHVGVHTKLNGREERKRTHTDTGRISKLHTESETKAVDCEATVLLL